MDELVDITAVVVVGDHRVRLTFGDGTVGDVDFSDREWHGVLEPLRDPEYFSQVAVDPEAGTITWPGGLDMAPEPLLEQARRNAHCCPVCGFHGLEAEPRSSSGGGSYEICPSCGFQFGVNDDDRGSSYESWRQSWIAGGCRWQAVGREAPACWNGLAQLQAAGLAKR